MPNIYTGLGVGSGLTGIAKDTANYDERQARRAQAKLLKQRAEMQAELMPAKQDIEEERLKGELRQLQAQNLKRVAFDSFDRYERTKDTKYLNLFLKEARSNNNPFGVADDILRVDKLERSPEFDKRLKQEGIEDLGAFYANPNLHNFAVATRADGSKDIINMDQIYGLTGYTSYMNEKQIQDLTSRAKKQALLAAGIPINQMTQVERAALAIAEQEGIPYAEALQQATKQSRKSSGSQLEREAQRIMEENPGMEWSEAIVQAKERLQMGTGSALERRVDELKRQNPDISDEEAFAQARKDLGKEPTKVKELQAAEEVRDKLQDVTKGDFFSADMTDPVTRRKVGPYITELEKLTGKELSTEDKRLARKYRDLIGLGQQAGTELTDEETGLLDSMLKNFRKYVQDNVDIEGTAAYETFRNTLRHALYGASLTKNEVSAFNKAVGSLGQQAGPVLQQLKVQMNSIKRQLQSIYDLNDETVAYYYLGSDLSSIDAAIEQIDERIDALQGTGVTLKPRDLQQSGQNIPPGERPSLDEIFGGGLNNEG